MKFYKRFPGDIIKKTSGLTMAQFGAYDRLIDWCYANEMPVDPEEVYTITHAQTPADRRDVDRVLAKFFTLCEDGFRQERIDEVIAEALPKIEAARANGKKGGRPVGSGKKPTGLSEETEAEANAKTSQSQTSPPTVKKEPRKRVPPHDAPPDVDPQVWADWHSLRKAKKAPVTQTVLDGARSEAAKAGMTFDAFLRVWCRRGTQGLEADWLKPHERSQGPPAETPYARQMREKAQVLGPGVAAKAPGQPTHLTVIEADGNDPQKLIA